MRVLLSKLRWSHWYFILLVLYLLPIWVFPYFPSQDGPHHLYTSWVFRQSFDPANYVIRDAYQWNMWPYPNLLAFLLLAYFMVFFPPLLAEKLLLTLYVLLFPAALVYLFNVVGQKDKTFALIGIILIYSYHSLFGFYNFIYSVPLCLLSWGYYIKHHHQMTPERWLWFLILVGLTYISHLMSFVTLLIGLFILMIAFSVKQTAAHTGLLQGMVQKISLKQWFFTGILPIFCLLALLAGGYWVVLKYFPWALENFEYTKGEHQFMWTQVTQFGPINFFTSLHKPVGVGLFWLLMAAIAITVIYRIKRRKWVCMTDTLLLIAIACLIVFFLPLHPEIHRYYVKQRLLLYVPLLLAPWLVVNWHRYLRCLFGAGLTLIALWHLGVTGYEMYHLNRELMDFNSGVGQLKPHSSYYGGYIKNYYWIRQFGLIYPSPFPFSRGYYGLGTHDVIDLDKPEKCNVCPVKDFQSTYKSTADYWVAWKFDKHWDLHVLQTHYRNIHSRGYLHLFEHHNHQIPPKTALWGTNDSGKKRLQINFQLQPDRIGQGVHGVDPDTPFSPGRFGWLTNSPAETLWNLKTLYPPDEHEIFRYAITADKDAAFRLALPNGQYKVTLYMMDGRANASFHNMSVIANDTTRLNNVIIPPRVPVKFSYTVTVTDQMLDQVFYSTWGKFSIPGLLSSTWLINGFVVEEL